MKTPESDSFEVSLKTTRTMAWPIFSRVYQSMLIPPSVLIMPSFTTNEPGPACCHPSRLLPLNSARLGVWAHMQWAVAKTNKQSAVLNRSTLHVLRDGGFMGPSGAPYIQSVSHHNRYDGVGQMGCR